MSSNRHAPTLRRQSIRMMIADELRVAHGGQVNGTVTSAPPTTGPTKTGTCTPTRTTVDANRLWRGFVATAAFHDKSSTVSAAPGQLSRIPKQLRCNRITQRHAGGVVLKQASASLSAAVGGSRKGHGGRRPG
jgi:hypothetical protein